LAASALLLPAATAMAQTVTPAVKSSIAPTGRLRIAINYGNAALAKKDPATGNLIGVSVDIAGELGRRLGLPVDLVSFEAAGKVSAAAAGNVWDVAFLARDPERAKDISFAAAYVVIEGNYVVRNDSPITTLGQVDQDGVRVVVSTPEAVAMFKSGNNQVVAGVKQALQQVIASDKGLRMIPEPFMEINQAMSTPAGRPEAST
jgi:polar amino acid transport system substrate-binding protein